MTLTDRLTAVPGIGPARITQFERLGLHTVQDLLWWFPRHYLDCRQPVFISDLKVGELAVVRVRATNIRSSRSRRGQAVVRATLADASGECEAIWFNQSFMAANLERVGEVVMIGKPTWDFRAKKITLASPQLTKETGILPIYSITKGLTSKIVGGLVERCLISVASEVPEPWPVEELVEAGLPMLEQALQWIHRPDHPEQIKAARRRFMFDDLVALQRGLWLERRSAERYQGPPVTANVELLQQYVQELPFTLTPGQKQAVWQMAQEMAGDGTGLMRRLLNGDVGSGKTVVAAALMLLAAKSGWQAVLMAPTDILVQQHAATLRRLLEPFDLKVGLVTARRKEWEADVLVGTHALAIAQPAFRQVGLVVIDEQHRFGVAQRDALWQRAGAGDRRPHLLALTATPIPRSLALVLFGGMDVTRLRDKPANRRPIETVVQKGDDSAVWSRMRDTLARREQVYVVCPLIEEVELSGVLLDERRSVTAVYEEIARALPDAQVGLLHGKLSGAEKDEMLRRFSSGEVQILVSTTVVEVGVDVPNATLMIIENAERFGIAQLHQLRGRVGRSDLPSTCVLVVRGGGQEALARCHAVSGSDDGFALAEYDLQQRGPGELIGMAQSGFSASFLGEIDLDLLERANQLGQKLTSQPVVA